MDGSEPGDIVAAAVLSGAPVDLQARQVRYVASVMRSWELQDVDRWLEYFALRRQPHSREHGMRIIGGWIGTSCRRVTDGRIH